MFRADCLFLALGLALLGAPAVAEPPALTPDEQATVSKLLSRAKDTKTPADEALQLLAEFGAKIIPLLEKESSTTDLAYKSRITDILLLMEPALSMPLLRKHLSFYQTELIAQYVRAAERVRSKEKSTGDIRKRLDLLGSPHQFICKYFATNATAEELPFLVDLVVQLANADFLLKYTGSYGEAGIVPWPGGNRVWGALEALIMRTKDPDLLKECQATLDKVYGPLEKAPAKTDYHRDLVSSYRSVDEILIRKVKKPEWEGGPYE